VAASKYEASLAEMNKGIAELKATLSVMRRERDALSSMAGLAGQVQLLERDAEEKRQAGSQLYAKCQPALVALFAEDVPAAEAMKAKLQSVIREQEQAATAGEANLRKQRNTVAAFDARITDATAALARLRDEAKAKREAVVADVLDGSPLETFQERLTLSEAKVATVSQQVAEVKAMKTVLDRGIKHAAEHHACLLCRRPFDAAEHGEFLTEQRAKEANLPRLEQQREEDLRRAGDVAAALQRARPLWEECQRLRDHAIPQAEAALKVLTDKHAAAQAELAEREAAVAQQQGRIKQAAALASEAETLERLAREAGVLQTRCDEQRRSLLQHTTAGEKSLEDLSNEVLAMEEELDEQERKRDSAVTKQQRAQTDITTLERTVTALREAVARTEARAQRTTTLERECKDLEAQNELIAREVTDLERAHATARAGKVDAEAARDKLRAEHSAREQEAGASVRTLEREMDVVSVQTNAIVGYAEAGKDEQLRRSNEALAAARARLEENERLLGELDGRVRTLDDELRNQDAQKRMIDDNVAYRQNVAAAEAVTAEIDAALAANEALGNGKEMRKEHDRLQTEAQAFLNEQNQARGRLATYKEQVDKARRELKDAAFKDIDERFRHANIELRTTEMANEDLNKYHGALDKALMAFHAAKMAEINKVVKELWQKTYRNQDIEHIAICSDAESTTGRSYNYRVVMKAGDAELDMRGRCSAGQKVLACLIIRLALAETFCLNCGILALDEPTTNLDAPNSTSLAAALTDIMQARRDQENFQLVVITHDVRFAHLIGQREHAEYYWRISKDEDMHSRIEKARAAMRFA
jgi:DNA repair protein RAD50